jgi:hypothetical protein
VTVSRLREAAAAHVGRLAGRAYDPATECVATAGGLNGMCAIQSVAVNAFARMATDVRTVNRRPAVRHPSRAARAGVLACC